MAFFGLKYFPNTQFSQWKHVHQMERCQDDTLKTTYFDQYTMILLHQKVPGVIAKLTGEEKKEISKRMKGMNDDAGKVEKEIIKT